MLKGMLILSSIVMSQTTYANEVTTTTTTTVVPAAQNAPATTTVVTPTTTTVTPTTTVPSTTVTTSQPLAGAYNPIEVTDQGVQNAAAFAISQMQQGTLVKVESAQVQVVAGMNYKMLLVVNQNGTNYQYNVVVYTPLPNTNQPMQLTTVQAMGAVITAKPTR